MKKIIPVIFLALCLTAFNNPVKDIKLQYTFKVGDQYEWVQTTTQKIAQSVGGMNQEITTTLEGLTKLKIVELTPNGAKIEIEHAKLSSKMSTPMGEIVMDSENDNGSNESKVLKAMTGKKFFFFMNSSGAIEKIEGAENLWSGLSSLGLDSNVETAMRQTMEKTFGKDALKGSLESALVFYPDKKVKKGDTWNHTVTALNFPIQTLNTWKLSDLNSSTAIVSATGVISTTDKENTIELPNGFKSKFDLSGNQTVEGSVDIKGGWPSEITISSTLDGKMTFLAGGPIPNDMEVPMKINAESVFKFIKK